MRKCCGSILITSISKKIPLVKAIKRACNRLSCSPLVFGADVNPKSIGSYFTDAFWEMPRLTDLSGSNLVTYCWDHGITAIIPTRDGELSFFAQNRELLHQHGIAVMVSGPEAIEICLDKLLFAERLSQLGFPVIPTVTDIEKIDCGSYVVKERYGAGSRSIGLNLSRNEAVLHASKLHAPVFQPFIEGREVSVDVYIDRSGQAKGAVVRTRDLVVDGESQITTTIRNETLEKLCLDLVEKLQLYGHVILQILISPTGEFHIIECNSRFGGASTLSLEVGLDSFYWFLLEASGENLDDYPFLRSVTEKKQIRHPEDLVLEAGIGV